MASIKSRIGKGTSVFGFSRSVGRMDVVGGWEESVEATGGVEGTGGEVWGREVWRGQEERCGDGRCGGDGR